MGFKGQIIQCFFFPREKNVPTRENFRFYSRENLALPVKKSLNPPVKNNLLPWKMKENYTREN